MAGAPSTSSISTEQSGGNINYTSAFISVTFLFFMWGVLTHLNDSLSPHLQNLFKLNHTQTSMIQFTFFGAYFLVSLPAGFIIKKIGYKNALIVGLIVSGIGSVLFYPAAEIRSFPVFLSALFILAAGITILQVGANAYITILGKPELASSRLNLSQAFNSLGGSISPLIGSYLILKGTETMTEIEKAARVQTPYVVFGIIFFLLAGLIIATKLPVIKYDEPKDGESQSVFKHKHLLLGVLGIFLYVGLEVSQGTFMIRFISSPEIGNMKEHEASQMLLIYYVGMMVGRFVGSWLMQKYNAGTLLGILGTGGVFFMLLAVFLTGEAAMYSVLMGGICNSIMFPTIFTLGLRRLGPLTGKGSALLVQGIVGGAIIPVVHGYVADSFSLQFSFVVPAICYLYILYFGFWGSKISEDTPKVEKSIFPA